MEINRTIGSRGSVGKLVTRNLGNLRERRPPRRWTLENLLKYRRREIPHVAMLFAAGFVTSIVKHHCILRGSVYRADWSRLAPEQILRLKAMLEANFPVHLLPAVFGGDVINYGILSRQKITTAGVGFLTDAFQNLTEIENFKFHGFGTGTNAESNGDTALQTELTTQYASDNTRPTGTQAEGASANIYRTVATLSPDSGANPLAITEHGLLSQAATGGGTLWDRSVFAAVNLVPAADSLQVTHDTTSSAEA